MANCLIGLGRQWLTDINYSLDGSAGCVSAADVVLYGLNIVVPLMTDELLKVNNVLSNHNRSRSIVYFK